MSDDEATPLGLEYATTPQLLGELKKRACNALIYLEIEEQEPSFRLTWAGDLIRLYGALHLRILSAMERSYTEAMSDFDDINDDGLE